LFIRLSVNTNKSIIVLNRIFLINELNNWNIRGFKRFWGRSSGHYNSEDVRVIAEIVERSPLLFF